jgi:hypothetical protein
MKSFSRLLLAPLLMTQAYASVDDPTWTNLIVQVQLPNGTPYFLNNIAATGARYSPQPILPDGARFELHTIRSEPLTTFVLQSTYVGTYVPMANVVIDTEDPWGKELNTDTFTNVTFANPGFAAQRTVPLNTPAKIRRTRADRPFKVYVTTSGILNGLTDPAPSKAVNFYHTIQSYGINGTGNPINRSQALNVTPALPQITTNAVHNPIIVNLTTVPGANRLKIRGEETYKIYSLEDTQDPANPIAPNELSSHIVQIWPMTDGTLSGISMDQEIRFSMPKVTFRYNDTYPGSNTFAQVYPGEVRNNVQGLIVPGSHKNNTSDPGVPENYTESTGGDFDRMFTNDGRYTMELLTVSPFDTIRLDYVSFTVHRTMQVNGSVTTIE